MSGNNLELDFDFEEESSAPLAPPPVVEEVGNNLELDFDFEEESNTPLAPPPVVGVTDEVISGKEIKDLKYYGVVKLKKDISA